VRGLAMERAQSVVGRNDIADWIPGCARRISTRTGGKTKVFPRQNTTINTVSPPSDPVRTLVTAQQLVVPVLHMGSRASATLEPLRASLYADADRGGM
jgi:hypothetical protein